MLKRKLTKVLENWLKSGHEKALLLTGARQVGKTTAVREFAGKFYKHFVEVNFVKNPIAKQAFDCPEQINANNPRPKSVP
ncbi:AAA domain-containing protein [Fibrobacter sp. UWH5]|uniref:AAA family ATPase n=1 Tax=Fibrobacter sp. UWH5 TaxID=1896211 RepID=UPI00091DA274|nr:AAA family ATPase [Fibrobacter sp. UWH5]SHL34260.1 AAA domain-containing protein [Fibrobacter sp. UWH5]